MGSGVAGMPGSQAIQGELRLGDVLSRTFDLYKRYFMKYFIVFLVVEAVVGVLTTLVTRAFVLPTLPPNPTPQQVFSWFPAFFGVLIPLITLTVTISWLFGSIADGTTIKLSSEALQRGQADLRGSLSFTVSKLLSILAVGLITGIIIGLGFIALIVPGIILAIMFSLALPSVIIENSGVLDSLGRSRKLVGNRWLKSFALYLVLITIIAVIALIASLISAPFGAASTVVSSLLSAFYLPIFPIALTVYYHSNAARISQPQTFQSQPAAGAMTQAGSKYCANCGTQLASWATFCSKCGAKQ
jgi:hypothetical protein